MKTLAQAVDELEAMLSESDRLTDSPQNRVRSVRLRRTIFDQVTLIGSLGPDSFDNPEQKNAFRVACSLLRTAMANHYATWPIVAIDLESPSYGASIKHVRLIFQRFIEWIRSSSANMPRRWSNAK